MSFQYDLTPHIEWDGPNVRAVRFNNAGQTCRWYSGSGIYRHVWLTTTDKLHVGHWGTAVQTPAVSKDSATVRVNTLIKNENDIPKTCTLITQVLNTDGKLIAASRSTSEIAAQDEHGFTQDLRIDRPALWFADSPMLYRASTIVETEGAITDHYPTPFGIRGVTWNSKQGLLVNGNKVFLKGVCIHHDLGCLGAAFHERAMERRLEVLKGIGCNAIRTSHNPPAPELPEMCDRMGFYVIDEAFDKWGGSHNEAFFKDWKRDLRSMIQRDRNHPCVILWSVGNEVRQQKNPEGPKILKMLTEFTHREDPNRKVTCGVSPNYVPNFVKATDIAALNYQEQWLTTRIASPLVSA